jgi:hypothetical protein
VITGLLVIAVIFTVGLIAGYTIRDVISRRRRRDYW